MLRIPEEMFENAMVALIELDMGEGVEEVAEAALAPVASPTRRNYKRSGPAGKQPAATRKRPRQNSVLSGRDSRGPRQTHRARGVLGIALSAGGPA